MFGRVDSELRFVLEHRLYRHALAPCVPEHRVDIQSDQVGELLVAQAVFDSVFFDRIHSAPSIAYSQHIFNRLIFFYCVLEIPNVRVVSLRYCNASPCLVGCDVPLPNNTRATKEVNFLDVNWIKESLRDYVAELINLRMGEGWSRKKCAEAAGVDFATIHRWREKEQTPSLQTAIKAIMGLGGSFMVWSATVERPDLGLILEYLLSHEDFSKDFAKVLNDPQLETQLSKIVPGLLPNGEEE